MLCKYDSSVVHKTEACLCGVFLENGHSKRKENRYQQVDESAKSSESSKDWHMTTDIHSKHGKTNLEPKATFGLLIWPI